MNNSTHLIPLTRGGFAIIDSEDYDLVSKYKWHLSTNGYAVACIYIGGGSKSTINECILMHRLIQETKRGFDTDHINGNKLDNRKANLRGVSRSLNNINKHKSWASSKIPGVSWHKAAKKWEAHIQYKGKKKYLGCYERIEDAAKARQEAVLKMFNSHQDIQFQTRSR